jgi:glycosyltransferase involved in cell wall biosynthesis
MEVIRFGNTLTDVETADVKNLPTRTVAASKRPVSVGILDHTGLSVGGGQLVACHLATMLSSFHSVDLIRDWREYSLDRLGSAFSLDISRVRPRILENAAFESFDVPGTYGFYQQIKRSRLLTEPYDLFIYCGCHAPPFCYAKRGLVYCHFPFSCRWPKVELKTSARWLARNRLDRWIRGKAYQALWQMRMKKYDAILANSSFTAQWVERHWGRPAEVVYPPVELTVPDIPKQNVVASLGRFDCSISGGKHQLAQIGAFREFLSGVSGDWRMCLIGSYHTANERAYLTTVQQAAQGLPVTFLVNADRGAVCQALAESKIFWHARGLSNDETETPYRAEHFGIATVEAMRARCVPIVIDSGGQREIVQEGRSGFLCKDLNELVQRTVEVARDECLFRVLSGRARQRSMDFTNEAFERRVTQIVSQYLAG